MQAQAFPTQPTSMEVDSQMDENSSHSPGSRGRIVDERILSDSTDSPLLGFVNIHRIPLSKTGISTTSVKERENLKVDEIMKNYHKKNKGTNKYEEINDIHDALKSNMKVYRQQQKSKIDVFLAALGKKEEVGGGNNCIAFLFLADSLYAISSGAGWQVLAGVADYKFPYVVAQQLLSDEGAICHKVRQLFGPYRLADTIRKKPAHLSELEIGDVCIGFTAALREGSSIFARPCLADVEQNQINVEIGMGRIKFHCKFSMSGVTDLIDYLDLIYNTPTPIRGNPFYTGIRPVDGPVYRALNETLKAKFHSWVNKNEYSEYLSRFDICHKYAQDFTRAVEITLHCCDEEYQIHANIPIARVVEMIRSAKSLAKSQNRTGGTPAKISFRAPGGKEYSEPLINYLEGELVHDDGKVYWRIGKVWYSFEDDYVKVIERKFQEVLSRQLMDKDDPNGLPLKWKKLGKRLVNEDVYNDSYINQPGYFVGDKKFPLTLELFDVMKVEDSNTFLYHVKRGFNQSTRVACSQIGNAALHITNLGRSNNTITVEASKLETIAKSEKVNLDVSVLKNYLGIEGCDGNRNNVTYVYSILSNDNMESSTVQTHITDYFESSQERKRSRSLNMEKNLKFEIDIPSLNNTLESAPTEMYELLCEAVRVDSSNKQSAVQQIIQKMLNFLVENNYLVKSDSPNGTYKTTTKLIYCSKAGDFGGLVTNALNQKDFGRAVSFIKEIFSPYISLFNSLGAKMAIIRLNNYLLKNVGLKKENFKINELYTETDQVIISQSPLPTPKKSAARRDTNSIGCRQSRGKSGSRRGR